MTGTSHRPLAEPFSTGVSWLARGLVASTLLHALVAIVWWVAIDRDDQREVDLVDIEVAPPPPKAEALPPEVAKPPESAPETAEEQHAATQPEQPEPDDEALAVRDAGVPDAPVDAPSDAPVDAAPRKRKPDAAVDAEVPLVAQADAGIDAGEDLTPIVRVDPDLPDGGLAKVTRDGAPGGDDAGVQVAAIESGSGVGSGPGTGSGEGSGVAAAIAQGSGSGAPGMDNQPAVDGAPTTAGTAANLLAYFPAGHLVTVMIRFDRLRDTEWEEPTLKLFKPMPDYVALFGTKDAPVADKVDTLVISSPRPRDATATTLVVHSQLSRADLRTFLANTDAPIKWSTARGGMVGKRSGKLFPGDKRVLLSPWKQWVVLAQPTDLGNLTSPATGNLETVEAKGKLPPWLQTLRTIEGESGIGPRGPALVMTLAGAPQRYKIPDVGLGIDSLPSPIRLSLALELVKQGWLVRGNIVFAKEADAAEFVQAVQDVQQRIIDSRVLSGLLRKQHALNVVTGLSLARTGARVSYATSMSIADTRALLAVAGATLDQYFQPQPQP